jgi:hypothetical protein
VVGPDEARELDPGFSIGCRSMTILVRESGMPSRGGDLLDDGVVLGYAFSLAGVDPGVAHFSSRVRSNRRLAAGLRWVGLVLFGGDALSCPNAAVRILDR